MTGEQDNVEIKVTKEAAGVENSQQESQVAEIQRGDVVMAVGVTSEAHEHKEPNKLKELHHDSRTPHELKKDIEETLEYMESSVFLAGLINGILSVAINTETDQTKAASIWPFSEGSIQLLYPVFCGMLLVPMAAYLRANKEKYPNINKALDILEPRLEGLFHRAAVLGTWYFTTFKYFVNMENYTNNQSNLINYGGYITMLLAFSKKLKSYAVGFSGNALAFNLIEIFKPIEFDSPSSQKIGAYIGAAAAGVMAYMLDKKLSNRAHNENSHHTAGTEVKHEHSIVGKAIEGLTAVSYLPARVKQVTEQVPKIAAYAKAAIIGSLPLGGITFFALKRKQRSPHFAHAANVHTSINKDAAAGHVQIEIKNEGESQPLLEKQKTCLKPFGWCS